MIHYSTAGVVCGIPDDQIVAPLFVSGIKLKLLKEPESDKTFDVTVNNHIDVDPDLKKIYGCLVSPKLVSDLGVDDSDNNVITLIEPEIDIKHSSSGFRCKTHGEVKLPISFSVKFSPSECKRMLKEYVNESYGHVRFYKDDISNTNIDHSQTRPPFGKITHIDETEVGYILTIMYDKLFDVLFDNYRHGTEELLCHPTIVADNKDKSVSPRIAWISLYRQNELIPNMTYDGIHDEYRNMEDNNE